MKVVFSEYIQEAEFGGAFAGFLTTLIFLVNSYNKTQTNTQLRITGNIFFDGESVKDAQVLVKGSPYAPD